MPQLGDVLRGLGSVLNPAVAQELAQEDAQKAGTERQLQTLALQQRIQRESPEHQARIEALKNEKLFREEISQAGGDPAKIAGAAVKYGKPELAVSLYNQQESRAARLQQAHDALEVRRQQLAQQGANQEATADLRRQQMALQAEIARGNQELKRMQFTMKADQQIQKSVQQLGGALEKANLPEADAVLGAVESALQKNPKIAEFISGPRSATPDWMAPEDIRSGRQAFTKLFNITLKNRSGAAVTVPEFERLKEEFGRGVFKTPKQLMDAVEQAREIINRHYASVASGFSKDALDAYNENIRGFGGRVVIDSDKVPAVKNQTSPTQIKSDADYNALPSGATYIAPDGTVRKKK
jgi:hypothetical protein